MSDSPAPSSTASTWAPLRVGIFRAPWIVNPVSNIGTWMQTVGAQWLLVHQPNGSILVALVQTAYALPDLMFAAVGGVLADTIDRRKLLIVDQTYRSRTLATGVGEATGWDALGDRCDTELVVLEGDEEGVKALDAFPSRQPHRVRTRESVATRF